MVLAWSMFNKKKIINVNIKENIMVVKLNHHSVGGYITMFLISHHFLAELRHFIISLLVL